ncbi:hypothetical protein [Elioraea tepidiphila]|jgi:hypothetical protein|uniref:hypothetical protein n=1 Tax=Elioraea tepidiphila TaxID=457934 RepID=UPI000373C5DA|nr:hypothetical protein [Elioraea tepidiphila]
MAQAMVGLIGGGLVEAILALVALEAAVLAVVLRRTGRGVALPGLLVTLLSGAALLLALRAALIGAGAVWIGAWLAAALAAHLLDLWLRLRP